MTYSRWEASVTTTIHHTYRVTHSRWQGWWETSVTLSEHYGYRKTHSSDRTVEKHVSKGKYIALIEKPITVRVLLCNMSENENISRLWKDPLQWECCRKICLTTNTDHSNRTTLSGDSAAQIQFFMFFSAFVNTWFCTLIKNLLVRCQVWIGFALSISLLGCIILKFKTSIFFTKSSPLDKSFNIFLGTSFMYDSNILSFWKKKMLCS